MSKVLRRKMVDELAKRYAVVKNFAVVDATGLTGVESVELRRELRPSKVRVSLVKNSVAFHTFEKTGLKALQKHLTGMNAIVAGNDAAAIAKKLVDFGKKTKKAAVKGAIFDGQEFGAKQVEELSKLPGRPEHYSMILGALNGVMSKFVGTLNEIPRSFVGTLKAIEDKQKGGK